MKENYLNMVCHLTWDGVNSIPELMGNSINAYLKKYGIDQFRIGICYKKLNP